MLDVGASCSLLVPLGLWILELGIFSQCGYILLPGCSGKPARQNKNRMSLKSFFEEFAARLRDFIVSSSSRPGAADPRIFESLALELFALQFEHNLAYRKICDARRVFIRVERPSSDQAGIFIMQNRWQSMKLRSGPGLWPTWLLREFPLLLWRRGPGRGGHFANHEQPLTNVMTNHWRLAIGNWLF